MRSVAVHFTSQTIIFSDLNGAKTLRDGVVRNFLWGQVLPNFMPRGALALPDFPGLFKNPVSKWQKVRVKIRTKAYFSKKY